MPRNVSLRSLPPRAEVHQPAVGRHVTCDREQHEGKVALGARTGREDAAVQVEEPQVIDLPRPRRTKAIRRAEIDRIVFVSPPRIDLCMGRGQKPSPRDYLELGVEQGERSVAKPRRGQGPCFRKAARRRKQRAAPTALVKWVDAERNEVRTARAQAIWRRHDGRVELAHVVACLSWDTHRVRTLDVTELDAKRCQRLRPQHLQPGAVARENACKLRWLRVGVPVASGRE